MIIKLTEARPNVMGFDELETVIYVNEALISTIDQDEDGTWILIPPYQKPIKVKETLNEISRMIK